MNVRLEMMMHIYLCAIIVAFSAVILIVVFQLLRQFQSKIGIVNSVYLRLEGLNEEEEMPMPMQIQMLQQVEEIVDQLRRLLVLQVQEQEQEEQEEPVEIHQEGQMLLDKVRWTILLSKTSQEVEIIEQLLKLKKNLQGPIIGQTEIGETLQIEQ